MPWSVRFYIYAYYSSSLLLYSFGIGVIFSSCSSASFIYWSVRTTIEGLSRSFFESILLRGSGDGLSAERTPETRFNDFSFCEWRLLKPAVEELNRLGAIGLS